MSRRRRPGTGAGVQGTAALLSARCDAGSVGQPNQLFNVIQLKWSGVDWSTMLSVDSHSDGDINALPVLTKAEVA